MAIERLTLILINIDHRSDKPNDSIKLAGV